jgi:hypothetical protein
MTNCSRDSPTPPKSVTWLKWRAKCALTLKALDAESPMVRRRSRDGSVVLRSLTYTM